MAEHTVKTIVFANQKGGVGKTTCAVNIAACTAKKGYKTLIVDCDPQGNATSGLGVDKRRLSASVYDVLINRVKSDEAIVATQVRGLSLIGLQ